MPPRPLYRWKSFWLGVFVLGFLAWAWLDSKQASSELTYAKYKLTHAGSGICFKYLDLRHSSGLVGRLWFRFAFPSDGGVLQSSTFEAPAIFRGSASCQPITYDSISSQLRAFHTPRNSAEQLIQPMIWDNVPGSLAIFIPHWLLMLAFLVPWTAFLAWRWWRMRREVRRN
jgi:hypothetical protein